MLKENGQIEGLLESLARFSDHAAVLSALKANQITPTRTIHVGPPWVFQKLCGQLDLPAILQRLLAGHKGEGPTARINIKCPDGTTKWLDLPAGAAEWTKPITPATINEAWDDFPLGIYKLRLYEGTPIAKILKHEQIFDLSDDPFGP